MVYLFVAAWAQLLDRLVATSYCLYVWLYWDKFDQSCCGFLLLVLTFPQLFWRRVDKITKSHKFLYTSLGFTVFSLVARILVLHHRQTFTLDSLRFRYRDHVPHIRGVYASPLWNGTIVAFSNAFWIIGRC